MTCPIPFIGDPCQSIADFFTVSPFWFYLFWGVVIVAVATIAGWYFNFLRPLAGIVAVAVGFGLFGYRKGEKETEARQKEREERNRARNEPSQQWKWPWEQ